jgi:hypothetical protein
LDIEDLTRRYRRYLQSYVPSLDFLFSID